MAKRQNILMIVSDQERSRGWIPPHLHQKLKNRQRILDEGLEFTRHYTHASPCSPSRASLFTGLYVPQHGVNENTIFPYQRALPHSIPTIGTRLRKAGYRTAYLGKWHLQHGPEPDMEAFGWGDWEGNDLHYMGWAGTGYQFDPIVTAQAERWLDKNAASDLEDNGKPWCLVVALVNPHDVMWFPADQKSYQEANPEELARSRELLGFAQWKEDDPLPVFPEPYDEVFDTLPPNFDDDLFTKPAVQRQWLWEQQHNLFGRIDRKDERAWKRHLDYYFKLHQSGDESIGRILAALDRSGAKDRTTLIYTADHGDMCGSHGLRSKGPFLYEEVMHIPLYVRAPGVTRPGTQTKAMSSHVDLARTIVGLAGGDGSDMPGMDLSPVLSAPEKPGRSSLLFVQEQSWYERCIHLRYASRGITDGRYKYARYFGVGGGFTQIGQPWEQPQLFTHEAEFEEHDHEWYDLQEDPYELVNLANDRSRRKELRDWFYRLREEEQQAWGAGK